jgi:hypothetical protein
MSDLGHSRRFGHWQVTSGLPQTTDIVGCYNKTFSLQHVQNLVSHMVVPSL